MRLLSLSCLLALACSPPEVFEDPTRPDSDAQLIESDTELVETDTVDSDTEQTPAGSSFTSGHYRATELSIVRSDDGVDINGDGVPDNALKTLMPLVDAALPNLDLSLPNLNLILSDMLTFEFTFILLELEQSNEQLTVTVYGGERDDGGTLRATARSFDETGAPVQQLLGSFASQTRFSAGPAPLLVPIQLVADDPVINVPTRAAWLRGDVDANHIDAFLVAAIKTTDAVDAILRPIVLDNVDPADQQAVIDLAETLIELAADVTVDGEPALSAAFRVRAEPAAWDLPLPP